MTLQWIRRLALVVALMLSAASFARGQQVTTEAPDASARVSPAILVLRGLGAERRPRGLESLMAAIARRTAVEKVVAGMTTSSPGARSPSSIAAVSARRLADDPEFTAMPCATPTYAAKAASNSRTFGPCEIQPERMVRSAACGSRASKGTVLRLTPGRRGA